MSGSAGAISDASAGLSRDQLKAAFDASGGNRESVLASERCGCFSCGEVFASSKIEHWADDGYTALCPRCGMDDVIGDSSGLPINRDFLSAVYDQFHGWLRNEE